MSRAEFMRRWEAQPELKFAERIEGVVGLMMTPAPFSRHANPSGLIS